MTIKHITHVVLLILTLCMFTRMTHATTLSAHTEPDSVGPSEPFNLILELDENAPPGLPDFGPLTHDFHIHGTAHSASYMYTNGQSKASTRWTVTLVPKRTGKVTIPSIQVGRARSRPITLNIGRHSAPQTSPHPQSVDSALFVQTKLSDKTPFLNQQLLYTVKIFHSSSILDAAYQPPSLANALIVPLGNNRQYQVIEKGRPYLVEEQKYAFFPQKTGAQVLFPPKFQALIYDDMPRRAEAHGDSASVDVSPIPSGFTQSTWLPAKAVSLNEHYDQTDKKMPEGSTLTRTITLKVVGLPAELLPPLDITKHDHFKSYPERPSFNNTVEGDNVVGSATIKINYLLNHSGDITIPEETITWFNTETQQKATVSLPAKTLHVTPDITYQTPQTLTPQKPETTPSVAEAPATATPDKSTSFMHELVFHIALLSIFVLGCVLFFFAQKKRAPKPPCPKTYLKTLKEACQSHQPEKTRDALLAWARTVWPNHPMLNLDDVIQQTNSPDVKAALHQLSEALYHPQKSTAWQGNRLWHAIQTFSKSYGRVSKKAAAENPLPPINP
ncbi:MAG: BatD family protein [Legionellaceae bacterium]|nr:BatD family protein [Legionellaceae bacterium]